MGFRMLTLLLAVVLVSAPAAASGPDPVRAHSSDYPSDPDMKRIFQADQADRADPARTNWSELAEQDERRRAEARTLLDAGRLRSGEDFYHAAFVFQHGDAPADYLLAHALATAAMARGRADAAWVAAATLDRYLLSIGQKQVYGTQFRRLPQGPTFREAFDRTLIPDPLRAATGVPTLVERPEGPPVNPCVLPEVTCLPAEPKASRSTPGRS